MLPRNGLAKNIQIVMIGLLLLSTIGCSRPYTRLSENEEGILATGAVGAAGGAVIGAITGAPLTGAVVGGAAGVAAGALTDDDE